MPGMDYRMGQAGGAAGAAVYASEERSGHPNFYFSTDDIDASIGKVRELGGQADDRSPVPGHGWFARCSDSEGNAFHLWQQDEAAG
jgi:predicted enzyme related to lactoylglutathione lyase